MRLKDNKMNYKCSVSSIGRLNVRKYISDEIENKRNYLIELYNRSIGMGFECATVGKIDYVYDNNNDNLKIIRYEEHLGRNGLLRIPYGFDSFYPERQSWEDYLKKRRTRIQKIDLGTIITIDKSVFTHLYVRDFIANYLISLPDGLLNYCIELAHIELNNIIYIEYNCFKQVELTTLKVDNEIFYGKDAMEEINRIKNYTIRMSAV